MTFDRRSLVLGTSLLALITSGSKKSFAAGPSGGASGSSGSVGAPYLGQVATRCQAPNTLNASFNQISTRTQLRARDNLTSISIAFGNWYCSPTVTGEAGAGAAATVTASIEYPAGTFTQVTFGGSPSGTIPDKGTLFSDYIRVNIPFGAAVGIRRWQSNPNGMIYLANWPYITGDASEFGTTVPDKTMGGTIGTGSLAVHLPPLAIIGMTTRPSVYCLGDSRVAGPQETGDTGDHGILARSIGGQLAYINGGCGGELANNFAVAANSVQRRALAAYCSHVACVFGINDITGNYSAASIITALGTINSLLQGQPFYVGTVAPKSTSSDSWATPVAPWSGAGGQTADANNSVRIALNESIRGGGVAGMAGFMEIADAVETGRNTGFWKGGFTTDGLHENRRATLAIMASRAVVPSMFMR